MNIIANATKYLSNTAVICKSRKFKYSDLINHAFFVSQMLKDLPPQSNIVFLAPQAYEFIPLQWGIWLAGHVAVPLCTNHPPPEWDYILQDTNTPIVLCHDSFIPKLSPLTHSRNLPLLTIPDFFSVPTKFERKVEVPQKDSSAQIIYTSGTTGRPKGAVTSHSAIYSQVSSLTSAWEWSSCDHILEILPLHHVHGNINVVTCALNSGALMTFHQKFEANAVWSEILNSNLSLLMGVPTIYLKLIQAYRSMQGSEQLEAKAACSRFRLMVCGSMALPEFTLHEWQGITNQVLLERYGMTECGMILSNSLHGKRKPGFVGKPLPGVEVSTKNSELLVKGPGLFSKYYNKPEATKEAFDSEGWFRTGDIVDKDSEGDYKILGRASVDILKVSGYKISALDVENDLLSHPAISEVSILGLPDAVYGTKIGMIFTANQQLSLKDIQTWCTSKMAPYKIPKVCLQVDEIPRNQMGKVNKKELVSLFN